MGGSGEPEGSLAKDPWKPTFHFPHVKKKNMVRDVWFDQHARDTITLPQRWLLFYYQQGKEKYRVQKTIFISSSPFVLRTIKDELIEYYQLPTLYSQNPLCGFRCIYTDVKKKVAYPVEWQWLKKQLQARSSPLQWMLSPSQSQEFWTCVLFRKYQYLIKKNDMGIFVLYLLYMNNFWINIWIYLFIYNHQIKNY